MTSIPMPYITDRIVIVIKIFLILIFDLLLKKIRHQRKTRTRNKKIWAHLSSNALSFQLILGILEPCVQRRMVTNSSQATAIEVAVIKDFK